MSPAADVLVISTACTHVIHELGLELPAGQAVPVPAKHLARVLELPGVVKSVPTIATAIPSED